MNEKTAQIDVNHSRPLDVHLWSDYAEINDVQVFWVGHCIRLIM